LELDPTDREKLLESQAAGSAGLPERHQWRGLGHRRFLFARVSPASRCRFAAAASTRRPSLSGWCGGRVLSAYNRPGDPGISIKANWGEAGVATKARANAAA
jgi:hypothetical protein